MFWIDPQVKRNIPAFFHQSPYIQLMFLIASSAAGRSSTFLPLSQDPFPEGSRQQHQETCRCQHRAAVFSKLLSFSTFFLCPILYTFRIFLYGNIQDPFARYTAPTYTPQADRHTDPAKPCMIHGLEKARRCKVYIEDDAKGNAIHDLLLKYSGCCHSMYLFLDLYFIPV